MIRRTSLIKNDKFSKYSQNNIYLKTENLQTTGSFKIRAIKKILERFKQDNHNSVIVASTGNRGKSTAYLCNEMDMQCTVYMPLNTPYNIIKEISDYNSTIKLEGLDFEETTKIAEKAAQEKNTPIIELYHDVDASLEYGNIVAEIVEDLPETDIILVPVGTGSLLSGILTYIKENNLKIDVYGVEPYTSASLYHSLKRGKPTKLTDNYSIAKTIDIKQVSKTFFENIQANVKGVIKVSDEELIDCFLDVIEENKMIVENAGLLSLAGSKYLSEKNKNVVCLMTGGNIDITTMSSLLEYALINKGRIFTFKTMLSDKPGELLEIADIIAKNDGNVIGLEHNQLSIITRQDKVALTVTVESLGLSHKFKICKALEDKGYRIELIDEHLGSGIDE